MNKDLITEKRTLKITCECGIKITKDSQARHKRTQKHQDLLMLKINNQYLNR